MKQYIKFTVLALMAGLGLSSCLDDSRFDPEHISYPAELSLGTFKTEYTPGNYEYNAVITKSAAGDTILYVIRTGKPESRDSGLVQTLLISDAIAYDDSAGVYTATAEVSAYGDDAPATVYLAYQRDQQRLTAQIIASGKTNTMVFKPATEQTVVGMWQSEEDADAYFVCWLYPLDADGVGKGIALFDMDSDADDVIYTQNGNTVIVTAAEGSEHEGESVELYFNSEYQLVGKVGGQEVVLDPITSEAVVPEYTFDHPLIGDYTYCGAWFSGPDPDLRLVPVSIDDPEASVFQIEHWGADVTFRFAWNMVDNAITVPMQEVGETYTHEGVDYPVYVSDIPSWNSRYSYANYPCYYDANTATFHFNVIYFIELGYFDLGDETFEVTGDAPEEGAVRKRLFRTRAKGGKTVAPNLILKKKDAPLPRLF
ncbi:MAG: hypothetical protein IJ722_00510 [Alloprevotella sp.]|nr:hypothetical protein [Alloprevotella sp.]